MDCDGDELGVFFSGAVRQNPAPRSWCGGLGDRNALEQRTDRGPDQPTQSYQAPDVRAGLLAASGARIAALVGRTLGELHGGSGHVARLIRGRLRSRIGATPP